MHHPDASMVLVRYGDASTKSARVQRDLQSRLVTNLRAMLDARGVAGTIEERWTRIFVHCDDVEAATAAAADTFGVVSASPVVQVDPTLDAVAEALGETAAAVHDGGSFAVRASRADKTHPFTSHDVERAGGTAVGEAIDAPVDLDDPDRTYYAEVRADDAFVCCEKRAGPGGLPLGSQSPLVALVSGGIDSPVAAYEVMRRGSPVIPVYVDLGDFGGPDHEARAMETVRTLASYAPNFDVRPYCVPGGDAVSLLAQEMHQGRMLSFHRFCYAVGERIAEREGASGIVTGEAIGQKSSQTTQNLGVVADAATLPVHRPLLTWDKNRITDRAHDIGTFADATIPAGCNRLAPSQAETHASREWLASVEPDDLFEMARTAAADADRLDVTAPD